MDGKGNSMKRGWMKKQGGIVKNWQLRWFVLRGQSLDYYTKDDENKLLGSIDLSIAKVVETPYNRDEPDRWQFDIAPAKGGRMATTHETYPIWCSCEEERNSWMNALRRAMYASIGGGVFGGPLKDVMNYDKLHYQCDVPHIVKQCADVIRETGTTVEGIFRLNGRLAVVKELKRRYDEGDRPNFHDELVDVHTAASLMKMYFRELPEPVIPFEHFESFLNLATSFKYKSNHDQNFKSLKTLIRQIPEENIHILDYLTRFLHEIAEHQAENKMTENNLSLIFGTNILRSEDDSPEFQMATQNLTTHVVLALVKWHDLVFCDDSQSEVIVSNTDFEQLINLSETPQSSVEQNNSEAPEVASDLAGIDFTPTPSHVNNSNVHIAPPIPPRAMDTEVTGKSDDQTKNSMLTSDTPVPPPRQSLQDRPGSVKTRQTSTRRPDRPTAVVHENERSPENSTSPDNNQSSTSTLIKVDREPNGFQSYIDSPLDSRISLNIGDLPTTVEDLQTLVLSLKLQLKERRREIDQLNTTHKTQLANMAKTILDERHSKEEALSRILHLTNQLIAYQSMYGPLNNQDSQT